MNHPFLALRRRACLWAVALACMAALPSQSQPSAPAASAAAVQAATSAAPVAPVVAAAPPAVQAPDLGPNPYGLAAVWAQGDLVARGTLLILLVMSLGSWTVLITRLLAQARVHRQAELAAGQFWKAESVRAGAAALDAQSPFRFVAEAGLAAAGKHVSLRGSTDLNVWLAQGIERSVSLVQGRMQAGLAVLATVGSTAPFVGLFGTVWGIYNALVRIGASGQASIDKVAGPVGEALIMTALGLAVAVPAVLGYNWLIRRNKLAMDRVRAFGSDLHTLLMSRDTRYD